MQSIEDLVSFKLDVPREELQAQTPEILGRMTIVLPLVNPFQSINSCALAYQKSIIFYKNSSMTKTASRGLRCVILFALLPIFSQTTYAQETLTWKQCVEMAKNNNNFTGIFFLSFYQTFIWNLFI